MADELELTKPLTDVDADVREYQSAAAGEAKQPKPQVPKIDASKLSQETQEVALEERKVTKTTPTEVSATQKSGAGQG